MENSSERTREGESRKRGRGSGRMKEVVEPKEFLGQKERVTAKEKKEERRLE